MLPRPIFLTTVADGRETRAWSSSLDVIGYRSSDKSLRKYNIWRKIFRKEKNELLIRVWISPDNKVSGVDPDERVQREMLLEFGAWIEGLILPRAE